MNSSSGRRGASGGITLLVRFAIIIGFRLLIDWSLMALSAQLGYIVHLEVIVCVLGNRNTLGVLYISYSVADDQRHK